MAESANRQRIVISYHEEDTQWADRVGAHFLRNENLAVWFDLITGETRHEIADALRAVLPQAKVVLLLISQNYLSSTWVTTGEGSKLLKSLADKGQHLFGLGVQDTKLEELSKLPPHYFPLNSTHLADATPERQDSAIARVGNVIGQILEGKTVAPSIVTEGNEIEPPIQVLWRFAKSNEVENALAIAANLGTTYNGVDQKITTSCLLFGLVEGGRERTTHFRTPQFLWKELTTRGTRVYEKVLVEEFPLLEAFREQGKLDVSLIPAKAQRVTPNVVRVFETAEEISRRTYPYIPRTSKPKAVSDAAPPEIGARHLLAALLVYNLGKGSIGAKWSLSKLVRDEVALRKGFYEFIVKSLPDDNHEDWKSILIDLKLPQTQEEPQQQAKPAPRDEDTFAQPSVAGFMADDWTGRDLLGITRDVNALASLVAAYKVEPPLSIGLFGDWGSGKSHFMRQMRKRVETLSRQARDSREPQNKLGYYKNIVQIEFNAWHYIEGNLWASLVDHIFANLRFSEGEGDDYVEQRRDELMQNLGVKEEIQKKIQSKVQERENQLREVKQREQQAVADRDDASLQLADFSQDVQSSLEKLSVQVGFTDQEEELLSRIGVKPGTVITAADVRKNYLELKHGWNRLKSWKLLLTDPWARRWILISTLPLLVLVGLWLLNRLDLKTALLPIATFIGAVYPAVKQAWSQLQNGLEVLKKRNEEVERERLKRITELKNEVAVLTKEVIDTKREGETIDKEVEQLKADIESTSSSRILAEFIEDRAAASDYRRHLGLLALIRRDFEKLRKLFEQQRKEEVAGQETRNDKRINRIVLYIDDLDRCPPDRVVQVLQAIHLLLAFPLFVVVVGVDSRWITRSLEQSYEWLREADEENQKRQEAENRDENGKSLGATPHDYLEKIFQIPFWLRSMNDTACIDFLDGLTNEAVDNDLPQLHQKIDKTEQPPRKVEQLEPLHVQLLDEGSAPTSNLNRSVTSVVEPIHDTPLVESHHTDKIDLAPRSLTFSNFEIDYMKNLVPLIGRSPRAVKRFLNCYRLIKVGLTPAEFETFIGEEGESLSYKAAMILLGILTGTPTVSGYFVNELKDWDVKADVFVNRLAFNEDLNQNADGKRLIKFFQTHDFGKPSVPLFKEMVTFEPRVSRFSFRINRADTATRKPAATA